MVLTRCGGNMLPFGFQLCKKLYKEKSSEGHVHGPEKVATATYRDFPSISIILKIRAFLQLLPRFSLKSKQNTEIEIRLLKACQILGGQ